MATDGGGCGGPFDKTLLEGEEVGLEATLGGKGDGMLRMTLSWRSTKDSFGAGQLRWGCFSCAREERGGEALVLSGCFACCHAALDAGEEGRWANCSASVIYLTRVEGAGGRDAASMSYWDGERSTRDASS